MFHLNDKERKSPLQTKGSELWPDRTTERDWLSYIVFNERSWGMGSDENENLGTTVRFFKSGRLTCLSGVPLSLWDLLYFGVSFPPGYCSWLGEVETGCGVFRLSSSGRLGTGSKTGCTSTLFVPCQHNPVILNRTTHKQPYIDYLLSHKSDRNVRSRVGKLYQ